MDGLDQRNDRLPAKVAVRALVPHGDDRGVFTELFRDEWNTGMSPVQWNAVHSAQGVLRGVHVHVVHADYLTLVAGRMLLALHDMRPESPTAGLGAMLVLDAATPQAVLVPPGVCHGFYFPVPSTLVYSVSAYWNAFDELGCRFDDAAFDFDWPERQPSLSPRDRDAGTYAEMRGRFLATRAQLGLDA